MSHDPEIRDSENVAPPERPATVTGRRYAGAVRPDACLVTIQHGTLGPPVYCFHALGGSAAVYGPLATHLGRNRPVYGLQSVGLITGARPDGTVPEMARRYAAEIRDSRSPDEVVLLGYSLGGVLALETARLLPVPPVLVVLDTDPLYTPDSAAGPWHTLAHQVLGVDLPVERLAGLPPTDSLELVRSAGSAQGRLPARFSLDRLARMLEVCRANERAAAAHVPAPYAHPVHVFRSGGAARQIDADMWHAFAARLTIHQVPTDHRDLLGPAGYPHLAAGLRDLLAGAAP